MESDDENIWMLLLYSGYLTVKKNIRNDLYELVIPNNEVYKYFGYAFIKNTFGNHRKFLFLGDYLTKGEIEKFSTEVKNLLSEIPSFKDLVAENSYHMFMIGILTLLVKEYSMKSNRESGNGYYDLVMKSKKKMILHLFLNLKSRMKKRI